MSCSELSDGADRALDEETAHHEGRESGSGEKWAFLGLGYPSFGKEKRQELVWT